MTKILDKPLVTISGKKSLFRSDLHQRIVRDLPQEGIEWRRQLDGCTKSVYVDVDFVDFDVDSVERSSERLARLSLTNINPNSSEKLTRIPSAEDHVSNDTNQSIAPKDVDSISSHGANEQLTDGQDFKISSPKDVSPSNDHPDEPSCKEGVQSTPTDHVNQISEAFFSQRLLGRPILHTYWVDKSDYESESQKAQFDDWIGQVQASTCTEWAIVIVEDGELKTQIGTALFKSKLQSSTNRANMSSTSINSLSQHSSSFLDRMKKGLSTILQLEVDSDRWLTLINQERTSNDSKVQESYVNFLKKLRNVIMASFSKQIELFEEQLRVQREMRIHPNWDFLNYFSKQEELAFAFEYLTLFDEALVQYDFVDALFSEYISSPSFNRDQEPLYDKWTSFKSWPPLCLDMGNEHSKLLRKKIIDREASLLEFRNYLFAKRCDLMLMQNEPWRVAASTGIFIHNCISEHRLLNISTPPGALNCWSFVSSLEILQRCECYSCTSTMENYSSNTVDLWNNARQDLADLGKMLKLISKDGAQRGDEELRNLLLKGLILNPIGGKPYQRDEISPLERLTDALGSCEKFEKHLIEISELTLGTYKHIGRKRHALFVGKNLADFYLARGNPAKALPFFNDLDRHFMSEIWEPLIADNRRNISLCCSLMKKEDFSSSIDSSQNNTQK